MITSRLVELAFCSCRGVGFLARLNLLPQNSVWTSKLVRRARPGRISWGVESNRHLDLNCPGLVWSHGTQRGLLMLQWAELHVMGKSNLWSHHSFEWPFPYFWCRLHSSGLLVVLPPCQRAERVRRGRVKSCSAFKMKTLLLVLGQQEETFIGDFDTNGSTLRNKTGSMVLE